MSVAVSAPAVVELLHVQPETPRTAEVLGALAEAAGAVGLTVHPTREYRGHADWLLVWGPGEPSRAKAMRRQVAAGGRAIALDLAYWHRDRKFRVSVDAPHPQSWVMAREWPATRFQQEPTPVVANRWNPKGPVMVAGIGRKASIQYGQAVLDWEAAMIRACAPRAVRYRPKQAGAPMPAGVKTVVAGGSIDDVLAGASLLITWHSNVAVDAIRMGIPVVCRDGAAAAVCPSELTADPQPLPTATRDRFLANLAWFQWDPSEAAACWRFLLELLA
jgi:hypothetical protein